MLRADHERIVRAYLHAKDHQRPHGFAQAFAADAVFRSTFAFETDWHSDAPVRGLADITDTFRGLGRGFENIVTFCLPESVHWADYSLRMRWVVVMTDRQTREVRVAWGDYAWTFSGPPERAQSLHVHMLAMRLVEPNDDLVEWSMSLPDVWCTGPQAAEALPDVIPGLADFLLGDPAQRTARTSLG